MQNTPITHNKPKRVLLADDDSDDRLLFENAYQDRKDIVLLPSVVNGEEVIKTLAKIIRDSELPDLIILDQNMPLLNGKQTLTLLKSQQRYAHIPVCICSTYADGKLSDECKKLGAYKVSGKPITDEEYKTMMDDFLLFFKN